MAVVIRWKSLGVYQVVGITVAVGVALVDVTQHRWGWKGVGVHGHKAMDWCTSKTLVSTLAPDDTDSDPEQSERVR